MKNVIRKEFSIIVDSLSSTIANVSLGVVGSLLAWVHKGSDSKLRSFFILINLASHNENLKLPTIIARSI